MSVVILTQDPGEPGVNGEVYLDEPPCPLCKKGRLIREQTADYMAEKLTCTAFSEETANQNCGQVFQLDRRR